MTTRDRETGRLWFSSAAEIGRAIGRCRHDIPRLVVRDGLPAFKYGGKWTALPSDVETWTRNMARKYRKRGSSS